MQTAHELLRTAYETEYRYPGDFGGFEADVDYFWDRENWSGHVRVRTPSEIEYAGRIRYADDQLRWEIASMIGQKWCIPFEEAEGSLRTYIEDDRSGRPGRAVRVEDGLDSRYCIRSGKIFQIDRRFGDLRFSINVQASEEIGDGRTLPVHYAAFYWSETNDRHVRTDLYYDEHIEVGGTYLPLARRIVTADDSGSVTRRILFRKHRLLQSRVP